MGYFKLGKMTLKSLFTKPETVRYPFETRPVIEDMKGHVENNIVECTLCGVCEKRCPTGCISVDKEAESWTINAFDCIQCRTCVRECPQDCLVMMPDYHKPAAIKEVSVTKKPEPTEEEKAEMARKEEERAAKIKAALEAKAAREAAKAAQEGAGVSQEGATAE